MSETKRYRYTHSDKKEMLAFVNGHLMAAALKDDNRDVIKLYRQETTSGADDATRAASRKIANELLFAIVIGYIDNDDLVSHLATTYPGEGYEAMNYIKSCFDNGDQDDKLSEANDNYYAVLMHKYTEETLTPEEFVRVCNVMDMSRIELKGSFRAIEGPIHAAQLIDMVKRIRYYKNDVRHLIGRLDEGSARKDPRKVQPVLEGILRAGRTKEASTAPTDMASALKIVMSDPDAKAQIAKLMGRNNDVPDRCDSCGIRHTGKCKSLLLSQGKPVPGWDTMDPQLKGRLQFRAQEIKDKGLFKDRPKVAVIKPVQIQIGKVSAASTRRLYIDSQGGTEFSYHFMISPVEVPV